MLFSKCIAAYMPPTSNIIIYKLLQNENATTKEIHSYTILKYNMKHDTGSKIASGIKSKKAIDLIWNDVVNGIQK